MEVMTANVKGSWKERGSERKTSHWTHRKVSMSVSKKLKTGKRYWNDGHRERLSDIV